MSECRLCAGQGHWITLRYARQALNLTDKEISALPTLLAEAPNGILWSLVQPTADQYHKEALKAEFCRFAINLPLANWHSDYKRRGQIS